MRTKLFLLSFLLFAISKINAQTVVSLPFYEGFDYTIGNTLVTAENVGEGPWNVHNFSSSFTVDPFIIASPAWTLPIGLPDATGNAVQFQGGSTDPAVEFAPIGNTGSIYASFMMRITEMSQITDTSGGYIFSFARLSDANNIYTSSVFIKANSFPPVDATGFYIGIGETNLGSETSPAGAPTGRECKYNSTVYSFNTDIFIVIKYNMDNQLSSIWINPEISIIEPSATEDTAHDDTTVARYDLIWARMNLIANASTPTTQLDEIRVGRSWQVVSGFPTFSVSKNELQNSVSLFPNPAKDVVRIETKNDMKISSIDAYNLLGQKVSSQSVLKDNQINVSSLTKGLYLLKLASDKGNFTKKVVIE